MTMQPGPRALVATVAVLLFSGCPPKPPKPLSTLPDLGLTGFQTFPTPRTFDGPGTVFRITRERIRFPVTRLNVPVEQAGDESFANYTKKVEWSLGFVLKYLGAQQV